MVHAKRSAPAAVAPIVSDGIEYSVPDFSSKAEGMKHNGGYVEAKDLKTGARIWLKEIYKPKVDGLLETDVQDVFIKSMRLEGRHLKIVDENGVSYKVPIE